MSVLRSWKHKWDPLYEEPTLRELLRSLALAFVHALRQNKLAAGLASAAFVIATFFAVTIQYDERPEYRATILPQIQRAEGEFLQAMEAANHADDESWRLQFFLLAHAKVKEILRIAEERKPHTAEARRAHSELIRYYSLANEEFAIIRTEMSIHQTMDYLAEWKNQQLTLEPIRRNWLDWVGFDNH